MRPWIAQTYRLGNLNQEDSDGMREVRAKSLRALIASMIVVGLLGAVVAPSTAVAPVLNLSPSSGPIGTKVTVSACGLVPGNTVLAGDITFDGEAWSSRSVEVDSSGCMCAMPLTVPPKPVGPIAVSVYDGNVTVTGVFTIKQPNITLYPTSGYKGDTVTVTGTGWVYPSVVTVTFQGSQMSTLYVDTAGHFVTSFVVPLTAAPANVIGASDSLGNVGPALAFNLKPPGITLSPLSGPPGTSIQLHGYGFEPFTGVNDLKFADFPISTAGLITNDTGAFVTTLDAPNLPGGGYIVTTTVGDVTLDACFTIYEPDVWALADEDLPTPVEDALATIGDELVRAWGYCDGEWRMYDPADPLGSNLTGLVRGRGSWVKVTADGTLIYRYLTIGWNNIGW